MAQYGRRQEDSLRRAIQLSKADTNRVKLWLRLGQLYAYVPASLSVSMDTAYAYAQKAAALSQVLHFASGYDESQLITARTFLPNDQSYRIIGLLQNKRFHSVSSALLLIGEQYLYKPGEQTTDLDSAEINVRQALRQGAATHNRSAQAEAMVALGHIYTERGNQAKARTYYDQSKPYLTKTQPLLLQAKLWYELGYGYDRTPNEIPLKIECYERALALYSHLGNYELAAFALKEMADMQQAQGQYAQALQNLLEVVRMQKAIRSRKLHFTYDLLGAVYSAMGDYEQALPYALAALESAKATGDTAYIDAFLWRLGRVYDEMGQREQGMRCYQQILARAQHSPKSLNTDILEPVIRITRELLTLNRPQEALNLLQQTVRQHQPTDKSEQFMTFIGFGEAYLKLKSYSLSESNFLSALHLVEHARFPLGNAKQEYFITAYITLSRLYTAKGQYAKAHDYLQQAFCSAAQRPDVTRSKNLHLQAFKLDSIQGNLQSAIAHYQRYKVLNDSIFNERKSHQLLAFQVQYDTQHKEHELKLRDKNIALLTQRSQAQQASLELQRTERNALLMSAVMLLAIIGLGYNRYQLKQRSNQQLLGQQQALQNRQQEIDRKNAALEVLVTEKEWLLKEIHHRVKNNLQIVMSLLNSQAISLTDKTALTAIQESQHRVQAMALIHQKIYQSERVAQVSMPAYLQELVTYLREAYEVAHVQFEMAVDPIELDIALAVPLGLIVNEALTNSLKYAFPAGRAGLIRLVLHRLPDAAYQLEIADNGVGLPSMYAPERSRSLGMKLMHGFGQQLGGELRLSSPPGLVISLLFGEEHPISTLTHSDYA